MVQGNTLSGFKNSYLVKFIFIFFALLSVWWISIYFRGLKDANENNYFTLIYPLMSLAGGLAGLFYSKKWGGFKSSLGTAISFFSFGILAQFMGQASYAYLIYIKGIEVPYPSIGDIGFFGSILFYIFAAYSLAKMIGAKSLKGKLISIFLPVIMLVVSYLFFLQGYEFDWSNKLKIFLDFGYPFGQAIYLSIAILAFLFSRNFLGGIMKKPIWILMFALIFQYCADFMFLYQSSAGTWSVGGINDYLYFVSYFLMTLALIYIGSTFDKIKTGELEDVVDVSESGVGLMGATSVLSRVVVEIIKRQERIAGQIAWEEAKNIEGLIVVDQQKEQVSFTDNSNENLKKIIDKLVAKYKSLFGDLAVQVSKDAARHLIAELPGNDVPESLQ